MFEIQDSLGGYWWHHISAENFGFMTKIPDLKNSSANISENVYKTILFLFDECNKIFVLEASILMNVSRNGA